MKLSSFLTTNEDGNETTTRKDLLVNIAYLAAALVSLFHLYTAYFGVFDAMIQRSIHLGVLMFVGFILFPARKDGHPGWRALDLACGLICLAISFYLLWGYETLIFRPPNSTDTVFGVLLTLLVIELGRRAIGWPLPIICIFALIYALFGQDLPGFLSHRGQSAATLAYSMLLTTEGIFGMALGVSATYVFLFVLFGVFLGESGGSRALIDLAKGTAGGARGGPAKVAIVGSAFFGSISGSAVANVVGTGSMTIPMMKKLGYPPDFAAGVEAVASTGGVIMPPVMGAVAFLMVEMLNTSYYTVALSAAIPAALYYTALFVMVDLRARRLGLESLPKSECPSVLKTLRQQWTALVPIAVLVYCLLFLKQSPMLSAFWAIVAIIVLMLLRSPTPATLGNIWQCLVKGGVTCISIAMGCALAGILMGVLNLSGLTMKISTLLVNLAGESTILLLLLTAFVSLVLGMGVTASVAYIVPAMLASPVLIRAGIDPIAANIFILYFAVVSYITPPVALASYAAAGIAGSDFFKTGWTAFKLGLSGFIIPFMVIYSPALVLVGSGPEIFLALVSAIIGTTLLGCAIERWMAGPLPALGSAALFVAALCLVKSGVMTDLVGIAIALCVYFYQKKCAVVRKPEGLLN